MTARLDPALVKHLGSKGIRVEQMDTVGAPKSVAGCGSLPHYCFTILPNRCW